MNLALIAYGPLGFLHWSANLQYRAYLVFGDSSGRPAVEADLVARALPAVEAVEHSFEEASVAAYSPSPQDSVAAYAPVSSSTTSIVAARPVASHRQEGGGSP